MAMNKTAGPTLMVRLADDFTLDKALAIIQDYKTNINIALRDKDLKTADEIYCCLDLQNELATIEDHLKDINRRLNNL